MAGIGMVVIWVFVLFLIFFFWMIGIWCGTRLVVGAYFKQKRLEQERARQSHVEGKAKA